MADEKYKELGELAYKTWDLYGGRSLGSGTQYEREAFEAVAREVLKAAQDQGIVWTEEDI